jgi:uncharacterized protein YutE (UPF0331/DUF86 family)
MVERHVVVRKLAQMADRAARARARCPATVEALAADADALDLVAFNPMLAVQACADVASHIVSDEGWTPAGSLGAAFERLAAHGVISGGSAKALRRAVGLRNVVAHGYAGIDVAAVHGAARVGVADLDTFAREVTAWLDRGTGSA